MARSELVTSPDPLPISSTLSPSLHVMSGRFAAKATAASLLCSWLDVAYRAAFSITRTRQQQLLQGPSQEEEHLELSLFGAVGVYLGLEEAILRTGCSRVK